MANRETLVAYLKQHHIHFLAPSSAQIKQKLSFPQLITSIIKQGDGHLQMGLMVCFIRNPKLAPTVLPLYNQLNAKTLLTLQRIYTSAVYLQQHWWPTLEIYLHQFPPLPDYFSQELGLPLPQEQYGKQGLYVLAHQWAEESNYNWHADIQRTMALFLEQLQREDNYVTS